MHRPLALSLALVPLAGCYFEGTVAYHPRISQELVTPGAGGAEATVAEEGGGWSAGVNIGFYLDVGIPWGPVRTVGVGFSPAVNGYGIAPSDPLVTGASKSLLLRGDVALPSRMLGRHFQESATFAYGWLGDTSSTIPPAMEPEEVAEAAGSMWFAGVGIDYRLPVRAWDGRMKNALFRLNLGVEHFRADLTNTDNRRVSLSSTGLGARFMFVPAFIGRYRKGPYEDLATSTSPGVSCPGGYYKQSCDSDGNCTSRWTCP